MSTSYYYLKEPVSSVRLQEGIDEECGGHDRVTIWIDRWGNAGTLAVPIGVGRKICLALAETDADDFRCPIFTTEGRDGLLVTENVRGLAGELVLVDELGRPCTVRDIRASGTRAYRGAGEGELNV